MHRPPSIHALPPAPAPRWLRAMVAAFAVLACWLALSAHAQALPPGSASSHSGLGLGAASIAVTDPVAQLAIDIAEHLPLVATGSGRSALPLHAPQALPHHLTVDELQGSELPLRADPGALRPRCHFAHAPLPGVPFASIDLPGRDRPPCLPDRRRP